jgi:NitT/TauT family transport system permease protein
MLAGLIGLLEILCRAGVVKPITLVAPTVMLGELARMISEGEIGEDAARTCIEVGGAFVLAVLIGTLAGAAIHALPRLRQAVAPVLVSWYAVPSFVFYPLLIALLGLSELPLIAIGVLSAAPAMMIATLSGLDRVPRVLRRVARVHRLGFWGTLRHITLPCALPNLFAGVKLCFAYAFIGVIAGEFILSGGGLGYAIAYAYDSFETPKMYALMLLVLAVGVSVNALLHGWEGRLLRRRQR